MPDEATAQISLILPQDLIDALEAKALSTVPPTRRNILIQEVLAVIADKRFDVVGLLQQRQRKASAA